ncbi:hypothetical protein NEMBOFW57_001771 [Staphylotrichum longicolle]|uniref:Ankyrin repeat protein n=1 Tax=Staphylotrichum longicolle TaxID=669026 RepID=A0AAD4I1Y8_9PEZI|nr:hypothetical protein NEMBOFW57_001771 [Staphylotrichum longicolle]
MLSNRSLEIGIRPWHVDEVVAAFASWAKDNDRLSIALLSRNEANIRAYFEDDYEKIEIAAHSEDVIEYVTAQLEERIRRGKLRLHNPLLKEEIALSMLPPTLSETYCRILKRIPKRQVRIAQMVLDFIAFAGAHLTIPWLEQAVSVPTTGGTLEPSDIIRRETISELLLLPLVAAITDADLKFFKHVLDTEVNDRIFGEDGASFGPALQAFLMRLNQLSKTSPGVLPLACMMWKFAVEWDPNIARLTSLLDTRIWLAEDSLPIWAISIIRSADTESLESLLSDPRVNHSTMRTENGGSLLHAALDIEGDVVAVEDLLATATRLLEAGFSPSAVNDVGKTPLHVWTWERWVSLNLDSESLEDLVRAFVRAGLGINMQDQYGQNVLHAAVQAGYDRQLEAILNVVDSETLDVALRTTTLEGCTPLMEALRLGQEPSAIVILKYCALDAKQPGLDRSTQVLLDSGMCVAGNGPIEPLHKLGRWPSLLCVRWLKALYPQGCGTRVDGRLPLDKCLHQCLVFQARVPSTFHEIVFELAAFDVGETNNSVKAATWDYFTTTVLRESRASKIYDRAELVNRVLFAMQCLVESGYLEAYEAVNDESGLAPMLAASAPDEWRSMDDLWPLSGESIAMVLGVLPG